MDSNEGIGGQVSPIKGLEKLSEYNATLSKLVLAERSKRQKLKAHYDTVLAAQETEIEDLLAWKEDRSFLDRKETDENGLKAENKRLRKENMALKGEIRELFAQLLEYVDHVHEDESSIAACAQSYDQNRVKELESVLEELEIDKYTAEQRIVRLEEQVQSLKTDNEMTTTRFEEMIDELQQTPAVNLAVIRKRHEEELRSLHRKLVAAEDEAMRLRHGNSASSR